MEKPNKNNKTFEESLKRLEEIVSRLELGDVPLEETITLFQEGMELVNFCHKKLEEVKHKVEMVVRDKNSFTLQPFEAKVENEEKETEEIELEEDIEDNDGELPFWKKTAKWYKILFY